MAVGLLVVVWVLLNPTDKLVPVLKALQVAEVRGAGILVRHRNRAENAGRLGECTIHLQRAGKNGIKAGDRATAAQSGIDQSARTGAGAAGASAGAAGARADRSAEAAGAAAGRTRDDAAVDAQRAAAGLGAQNVGVGNVQVVALNGDIEIVLQGQRDRVVHGEHRACHSASSCSIRGVLLRSGGGTVCGR